MLGFAQIISVGDFPVSVWVPRYSEHAANRRSINGGLMLVCFSVTLGVAVSM